jgi:hypothetical protein
MPRAITSAISSAPTRANTAQIVHTLVDHFFRQVAPGLFAPLLDLCSPMLVQASQAALLVVAPILCVFSDCSVF